MNATLPEAEDTGSTPRWVKVFATIGIVLVLVFVILHLTSNSPRGHIPPSTATEHRVKQP